MATIQQKNKLLPVCPACDNMVVKSAGCTLTDSEGKKYLDFESGVWCSNLGHSHSRIVKTIEGQIKETIHHGYSFSNPYAGKLSEKLGLITGINDCQTTFLSSGSEAVNLSILLAQHLTGRPNILRISETYLSAVGIARLSPGNHSTITVALNDIEGISQLDFNSISAIIIETGMASFGVVRFPSNRFIEQLTDKAASCGTYIIVDEVTTGIGRTGKWFGYQHYSIKPDIIALGKGLGNGYPVSAVVTTGKVGQKLLNSPFIYKQSHQNDSLGCAISLEVLQTIEDEGILHHTNFIGEYFFQRLKKIAGMHHHLIREARGRGLMLALELQPHVKGDDIHKKLWDKGFIVGFNNNTLRFMPPLVVHQMEVDMLIDALEQVFTQ